jgi:hypothetical protein
MLEALLTRFPNVQPERLAGLAAVWNIQRDRVITRMIAIAADEIGPVIPTPSRERLILELAQLSVRLEGQIVAKNTAATSIEQLDPEAERVGLETQLIRERIENTARNLATRVWIPLLQRERARNQLLLDKDGATAKSRRGKVVTKKDGQGVNEQHYTPAFANRYWASKPKGLIRVYSRRVDHQIQASDVGYSAWGRATRLYSQRLEKLFGLIEGDAQQPYSKLLSVVPLTENERRRWIAFLIAQRLRTPRSIRVQLVGLKRLILQRRIPYSTKVADLRAAYETLFTNNDVFAHFYRLVDARAWQIWRAASGTHFLRSDEPLLILGSVNRSNWQLIYPLSPRRCFVVGPASRADETAARIVPFSRLLSDVETAETNRRVARSARLSVIARPVEDDQAVWELLSAHLGDQEPASTDLEESLLEYWKPL